MVPALNNAVMTFSLEPPDFWYAEPRGLSRMIATALTPFAAAYGVIAARRMRQSGFRSALPVICVGNFTIGGAGKTPTAIALAQTLIDLGETPFLLTRGYRSRAEHGLPLRVEPDRHQAADVGDEALLLARVAPTLVSADRVASAKLAQAQGASVLVLDDGLQTPALEKNVRIVVIDAVTGIGNGLCLPAGPLRAPFAMQLGLADALVILGDGAPGRSIAETARRRGKTAIAARLEVSKEQASALSGRRVHAFAGIGRPEKFFATLAEIGAQIVEKRAFPDHHAYTHAEIIGLQRAAKARDALLVTTEKDFVRLRPLEDFVHPDLPVPQPIPVTLRFADPPAFVALVKRAAAQGKP